MVRVKAPYPFSLMMIGPEGRYTLRFTPDPNDTWEGTIVVQFPTEWTWWPVHRVDDDGNGLQLGGVAGLDDWHNSYWFELSLEAAPPRIEYWGKGVLWRVDYEIKP